MSDDLSSFFDSKKKGKKKKAGAKDMDTLAKRLETASKRQEEHDRLEELRRRAEQEEQFIANRAAPEDSEWIDVTEKKIDIASAGIRQMDVLDDEEEDVQQEEQAAPTEKPKTWGAIQEEAQEKVEKENATPTPAAAVAPSKYQPPSSRLGMGASTMGRRQQNVDINNEEMFPSLDVADDIATKKAEQEKEIERRRMEDAIRNAAPVPANLLQDSGEPANPNAWVPPHLRKADAGPSPAGAWGQRLSLICCRQLLTRGRRQRPFYKYSDSLQQQKKCDLLFMNM